MSLTLAFASNGESRGRHATAFVKKTFHLNAATDSSKGGSIPGDESDNLQNGFSQRTTNGKSNEDEDASSSEFPSFFGGDPSLPMIKTPSSGKMTPPSKADVYSNDELMTLLNIHTNLTESMPGFGGATRANEEEKEEAPEIGNILSLQDLVEQTVQEISNEQQSPSMSSTLKFDSHFTSDDLRELLPKIRGIASDVDGTLLSKDHKLHPNTQQAIERAVEAVFSPIHPLQHFFLATGKTRAGALNSLGPEVTALLQNSPGVFIQGVYCVGADGKVLFEQKLSRVAVEESNGITERHGISLIAYDGDALYASDSSNGKHVDDVAEKYGEPRPEKLTDIAAHEPGFHKLLLMSDDTDYLTNKVRPELEELARKLDCVVTQAIPTMLELLPAGCSKAAGVQKLCEALNLDLATQVCAVGDAENDLEMLRLAAVGIAVGNAAPMVKEAAAVVLEETNCEGGAGRAIELFGLGKLIDLLEA